MPEGYELTFVPAEVRHAISCVVQPVYERLVVQSDDPLEKSLGVTVSHLLWLEILQQMDLKRDYTQVTAVLELAADHRPLIEQHLRILDTKVKVGYLLARLRHLRQRARDDMPVAILPADCVPAAALPSHSGAPLPPV